MDFYSLYVVCSCCYPIPKQWADRRVGPMTFTTVISLGNPRGNDTTQGTVYAWCSLVDVKQMQLGLMTNEGRKWTTNTTNSGDFHSWSKPYSHRHWVFPNVKVRHLRYERSCISVNLTWNILSEATARHTSMCVLAYVSWSSFRSRSLIHTITVAGPTCLMFS